MGNPRDSGNYNLRLEPEVFDYFARDPIGVQLSLPDVADDKEHPLFEAITRLLEVVGVEEAEAAKRDAIFQAMHGAESRESINRKAKVWALSEWLSREIPRRRLKLLAAQCSSSRPRPYDLTCLDYVKVREDFLVPIAAFDTDRGVLLKNGFAFSVCPTVESPNASHWLFLELATKYSSCSFVRLDPFLNGPEASFPRMEYKLWWYGRTLDWDRLRSLNGEEHGQWAPRWSNEGTSRTDFVWSRRGKELHFECEELPAEERRMTRAARYFHAVMNMTVNRFIHMDGALRIYDDKEWELRKSQHVRHVDKAGLRIKLFLVDGHVLPEDFGAICSAFFMWNSDIAKYFTPSQ